MRLSDRSRGRSQRTREPLGQVQLGRPTLKVIALRHTLNGQHVLHVDAVLRSVREELQQYQIGCSADEQRTPAQILAGKYPERVLEKAVERMLPKESPLARKQMTQLRIYKGAEHPHEAQNPETIAFADLNAKNVRSA